MSRQRQKISKKNDFDVSILTIIAELETLNNMSKQAEAIKQRLNNMPTYQFDGTATQRLELLRNAFNQFQFEIIAVEQQYCDNSDIPFDLNASIIKLQAKIWAFEIEIKTLEAYLYRQNISGEVE